MRQALLAALAAATLVAGCAPDPLTMNERVELMVHMNKQLQFELLEAHRRIAELSGGQGTVEPQHAPDQLSPGMALVDDPFRALHVTLHRLTGGMDTDGNPGDEGLRVILQPRDKAGDVVKRAGAVEVELFDLARTEGDRRIARWEFTVDQTAREWVSGLLGVSGYSFQLPWPGGRRPEHSHLTLMARFTTLDGRPLTAQTDLKIQLPPAGGAPAAGP